MTDTPRQGTHPPSLTSLSLAFLCLTASLETPAAKPLDTEEFELMMNTLDSLQSDNLGDRRNAAEDSEYAFDPLADLDPLAPPSDTLRVLALLRGTIELPRDEWTAFRVLENLINTDSTLLSPLYLEALRGPSENAHWQAIRWFARHEDPDAAELLESAWRHESRPWVRVDLIGALTRNRSAVHWSDLLRFAPRRDPAFAVAAINAFSDSRLPEALPVIAELASSESAWVRRTAVEALPNWADSPLALETLLSVSEADDKFVRDCAAFSLTAFDSSEAIERIQEIALQDEHLMDRLAAVHALQRVRHPGTVPILVELLRQRAQVEPILLVDAALETLHLLDEASAVRGLRGLDPSLGLGRNTVASVIGYLSRDRSLLPGDSESRPYVCGTTDWEGYSSSLDPTDPRVLQVVPPAGMHSVRCDQSPGVPSKPVNWMRLSAGSSVRIYDYFEGEDERWVEVDNLEGVNCWIPRRLLGPILDPNSWSEETVESRTEREFDIPIEEALSEHASALREAGLLRWIDPRRGGGRRHAG